MTDLSKRIGWDSKLQRFSAEALAKQTREVLAGKKRIVVVKPGGKLHCKD